MATPLVFAAVGLGSNLGDREGLIAGAARDLSARTTGFRLSSSYETPAMTLEGSPPQPDYLNAAAVFFTPLAPATLLAQLLEIERLAGRDRTDEPRWGARRLDLDLLLYSDRVIDTPGLRVPHPGMTERAFVLEPLAEIAPDAVHPVARVRVGVLLERLRRGTMPS